MCRRRSLGIWGKIAVVAVAVALHRATPAAGWSVSDTDAAAVATAAAAEADIRLNSELSQVAGDRGSDRRPAPAARPLVPDMLVHAARQLLDLARGPHKALWPLGTRDWLGFALAAFSLFVAAGGGLGGGALLIPIFLLVMGFSMHEAVALSNVTIVGGAIANLAVNIGRKHTLKAGPLIDWDICVVMEPATILGALVGGYVNRVLPSWLTTALLTLLLAYMSSKLSVKAAATWRREGFKQRASSGSVALGQSLLSRRSSSLGEPGSDPTGPSMAPAPAAQAQDVDDSAAHARAGAGGLGSATEPGDACLDEGYDSGEEADDVQVTHGTVVRSLRTLSHTWTIVRERQVPRDRLALMVLMFVGVLGSELGKEGLRCGSWQYWLAVLAIVPFLAAIMVASRRMLLRKQAVRRAQRALFVEGDVEWTARTTLVYPAVSSLAGLVAGMFGIGGGVVKGPLMLEMGVLPEVAAATSATMILFTSASASLVYLSFGVLQGDYAIVVFCIGMLVTLLGQLFVYQLMKLLGRRSIIIIAMATFMVIAAAVMAVQSVQATASAARHHTMLDFAGICG